jgi:hypothetical protein
MNIERIKEIQDETAYPNSTSVQQALIKVWNETERNQTKLPSYQHSIELIAKERNRQIEQEGYDIKHDNSHIHGEIANAAAYYAATPLYRKIYALEGLWVWDKKYLKPTPNNRVKELVKAGALIAAEIERLQRNEI